MKFSKMLEVSIPDFGDCTDLLTNKKLIYSEEQIKDNFTFIKKIKDLYLYRLSYEYENGVYIFILFEIKKRKQFKVI